MSFGANETPVSVIREAESGGTYFRDIILVLMKSGTESHDKSLLFGLL